MYQVVLNGPVCMHLILPLPFLFYEYLSLDGIYYNMKYLVQQVQHHMVPSLIADAFPKFILKFIKCVKQMKRSS